MAEDFGHYYDLSKKLALQNKKLAEQINYINTDSFNLCQQMQLMIELDEIKREAKEAGERYNKAIKSDQNLRDQIQSLRDRVAAAEATAKQAKQELSANMGAVSVGNFFASLCRMYPNEVKAIADKYCKKTKQALTVRCGGGFELTFGGEKVREIE